MTRFVLHLEWSGSGNMVDNWVSRYMENNSDDERRRAAEQRRAELAAAGAEHFFRHLGNRVKEDVDSFHNARGDPRLKYQFVPSRTFVVRRGEYPSVTLQVSLREIYIDYFYSFKQDHTSTTEKQEGTIILSADLQGRIQVKRNGESYSDYSEISELLLKPVFDKAIER